jgi:small-conductance mechanosensitive channel
LTAFVQRVPALFFAIFVLFAATIIVRALHRFAAYLRGELKTKPKRLAPPQALAFTEIVLKYLIYIGAVVLAIFGAIRALPAEDQDVIRQNLGTLPGIPESAIIGVLIGILIVGIADRFIDSIFEDWKRRTRKFTARVVDEFKTITRYGVWVLGAIVLLFIILALVLSEAQLIVFAVGFVAFLIAAATIAFDPVRNALAGVTLMRADPFDIGDRVKIGSDLVCDVQSMSLTLTQVRTLRGEVVNLPNSRLLTEPIVNFSRSKPYAIFVEVCVDFGVDHSKVRDLLLRAARETEGIVPEPAPQALGKDLEGSSIRYQLLAYTSQPERMKECRSALIYKIQELFGQAGIRPIGHPTGS